MKTNTSIIKILMAITLLSANAAIAVVSIELVPVGNPGNTADTNGYGAVAYNYNIGKYEVTVGQYVDFLNYKEIDKSTPLLISIDAMAANHIELDTTVNPFIFRTPSEYINNPVTYITFWNACRFVNWLGNGQADGDTETGTYTLNGYNGTAGAQIGRSAGAIWFIPDFNEWYKAAYYAGSTDGGYFAEPASSIYGTSDQYGNGWEWSDSVVSVAAADGRILGGGYGPLDASVPVDFKGTSLGDPSKSSGPSLPWGFNIPVDDGGFGFRVASSPQTLDKVDYADFAVLAAAWLSSEGDANWNPICNLAAPNDIIDTADLTAFAANWLTLSNQ